jgi:hypothetical protein
VAPESFSSILVLTGKEDTPDGFMGDLIVVCNRSERFVVLSDTTHDIRPF